MCGSHIGSIAFVGKAFRQGFNWPTALQDAVELVMTCEACQFHSKKTHLPAQALSDNPSIMAIFGLGARYPRPLPPSNRGL